MDIEEVCDTVVTLSTESPMNVVLLPDESSKRGFAFIAAKAVLLAFAATSLVLAAIHLIVRGSEESQGMRRTGSYGDTMPPQYSFQPKAELPVSAHTSEPVRKVTEGLNPPKPANPEIETALSVDQEKKPGQQGKETRPWAINVASLRSKNSVQDLVEKLKKAGYNAYIVEWNQKGGGWYRARVGHFPSREEAGRTARQISQTYGLKKPWLVKESP